MKFKTNNQEHTCTHYSSGPSEVRVTLPGGAPAALGDTVELLRDDGFVLAEHRVSDFARWYAAGTSLVLTNLPEPGPTPEPQPPQPTFEDQMSEALISLYEEGRQRDKVNAQQDEAIISLFEGGVTR